jgi:hypothetical protein
MKSKKRFSPEERRGRPSLEGRVSQRAKELHDQALQMPPGRERDQLLKRALRMDVAHLINEWITAPDLKPSQ